MKAGTLAKLTCPPDALLRYEEHMRNSYSCQ